MADRPHHSSGEHSEGEEKMTFSFEFPPAFVQRLFQSLRNRIGGVLLLSAVAITSFAAGTSFDRDPRPLDVDPHEIKQIFEILRFALQARNQEESEEKQTKYMMMIAKAIRLRDHETIQAAMVSYDNDGSFSKIEVPISIKGGKGLSRIVILKHDGTAKVYRIESRD